MTVSIWVLFFHIVRLYLRLCSPFIFLLFVIIELAKLIIFLKISICRVIDYSILFTREITALLSLIQWKSDSKLLKQQLLDVFWWYSTTGAAGWNCTFLVIFALPIGTPNIWYVFVSSSLNLVWYSFYINLVHVSWNFLLTTHDQDLTNILILLIVLGSYISWSFIFPFFLSDSLRRIITTFSYNPCSIAFLYAFI